MYVHTALQTKMKNGRNFVKKHSLGIFKTLGVDFERKFSSKSIWFAFVCDNKTYFN
jgi:hypothetical protein